MGGLNRVNRYYLGSCKWSKKKDKYEYSVTSTD